MSRVPVLFLVLLAMFSWASIAAFGIDWSWLADPAYVKRNVVVATRRESPAAVLPPALLGTSANAAGIVAVPPAMRSSVSATAQEDEATTTVGFARFIGPPGSPDPALSTLGSAVQAAPQAPASTSIEADDRPVAIEQPIVIASLASDIEARPLDHDVSVVKPAGRPGIVPVDQQPLRPVAQTATTPRAGAMSRQAAAAPGRAKSAAGKSAAQPTALDPPAAKAPDRKASTVKLTARTGSDRDHQMPSPKKSAGKSAPEAAKAVRKVTEGKKPAPAAKPSRPAAARTANRERKQVAEAD